MEAHLDGHGLSGATHLYAGLVHGTQVHQNRPVILIQQNVSGLQVSGERGRRDGRHEVRKTGKKRQGMLTDVRTEERRMERNTRHMRNKKLSRQEREWHLKQRG